MAANNHFDATHMGAVVYNKDKEEIITTRPNARELVASGNFFWKAADVRADRLESDGPIDPSATMITIYKDGESIEVSRANARELVASGEYTWATAHADEEDEEVTENVVEEAAEKTAADPVVEDPLDPNTQDLRDIASRVTGDDDVSKYLETFSVENLRQMAEERFGEKVHHRASKDTVVARMVELEELRLAAE